MPIDPSLGQQRIAAALMGGQQPMFSPIVQRDKPPMPITDRKSLQLRLESAEGDEDLLAIKKELLQQGIDPRAVPELNGL